MDIEEVILNSFKVQNLEKEIFNALFNLLDKNFDLYNCISLCLLNSIKNKKEKEIDVLVKCNIKKFEKYIMNNIINFNLIEILCKASFEIYSNFGLLKNFVFFKKKLKEIKKENILALLDFIPYNKVKIVDYHIKLIEDNLNIDGYFHLLVTIIENNEINLIKKLDANKIISNLYFNFKNGICLLYKIIRFKNIFNDDFLIILSNYLYNNHKEDELNNLYIEIKNLFTLISYEQKLPKEVKVRLDLEDFSFTDNKVDNKMILSKDILSKNKIPKRYFKKLKNILNNKNIRHDIKIEFITKIFLDFLEKDGIIPNELYKKFFSLILNLEDLIQIKYNLINKNANKTLKNYFIKNSMNF